MVTAVLESLREEINRALQTLNERERNIIEAFFGINQQEMTLEEAKKSGAVGVFESKYGEKVKVYTIGYISKEICGGPHAKNTKDLHHFKIVKEESSSAGIRRIKAILD